MGLRYTVSRDAVTPTGGNDVLTILPAAGRRVRPVQISIAGAGSTSAAQRLFLVRSTGGTTGGGAITPNDGEHSDQPAAASTVNTTWSAQPTVDTNGIHLGFNALGGAIVYNVPPSFLSARDTERISLRALSGPTYQSMSVSVVFEED